jgi:hypothetical protein
MVKSFVVADYMSEELVLLNEHEPGPMTTDFVYLLSHCLHVFVSMELQLLARQFKVQNGLLCVTRSRPKRVIKAINVRRCTLVEEMKCLFIIFIHMNLQMHMVLGLSVFLLINNILMIKFTNDKLQS